MTHDLAILLQFGATLGLAVAIALQGTVLVYSLIALNLLLCAMRYLYDLADKRRRASREKDRCTVISTQHGSYLATP